MNSPRPLPVFPAPDKRQRPAQRMKFIPTSAALGAATDPEIDGVVSAVDANRLAQSVKSLADFPTRHSLSPKNVEAAKWLRDQFTSLGYTDVVLSDVTIQGLIRHNVACTRKGSTNANTHILVGAHYDSRMSDLSDSHATAPGSDDNASGAAALIELARVLKSVDLPCSVRFVAFTGEEQGLLGSSAYADLVHRLGLNIRLMINLDMIGYPDNAAHPSITIERDLGNAVPSNDAASQAAANVMANLATTYTSLESHLGPIYSSDYMPFEHFGYPCIGVFDGADNQPFYHSVNDTPNKVVPAFHADVVRMVAATIVAISRQ